MKFIIPLIFIFAAASAFADNFIDDSTASCYPYWNVGESRRYDVNSGTTEIMADSTDTTRLEYSTVVRVIDSTNSGYQMQWVNYDMPPTSAGSKNVLDKFLMAIKSIPAEYSVGIYGSLIGMNNMPEYKRKLDSVVSEISSDAGLRPEAETQIRTMFLNDEFITRTVLNEINLYHSPYAGIYSMEKDSIKFPVTATSGDTIWTRVFYVINKLDRKNDFYDMEIRVEYDPTTVNRMIRPYIRENMHKYSPDPDSAEIMIDEALAKSKMYDIQNYRISIATGWIQYVYTQRIVEVNFGRQFKSIEFFEMTIRNN